MGYISNICDNISINIFISNIENLKILINDKKNIVLWIIRRPENGKQPSNFLQYVPISKKIFILANTYYSLQIPFNSINFIFHDEHNLDNYNSGNTTL